jgi:hypothetical protein
MARRQQPHAAPGRVAQALYRARQFFGAALARVDAPERAAILAAAQMPPPLAALFQRMPRPYQWHALNVARRLRAAGHDDPVLLQAALLHDMGKWDPATGRRVLLPYRVAAVLLRRAPGGPRLLRRLGAGPPGPRSWRYPWHLQNQHPALGAHVAAAHGAPHEVVALIRHHEQLTPALPPRQQARLRLLQDADARE